MTEDRDALATAAGPAAAPDHDLFVSYAPADRAWVRGYLFDALDEAGVRYLDEGDLPMGRPRIVELERAIKRSGRTLLVLSPAYLADAFGQVAELLAETYGFETSTWPVIPLLLEPVELPLRLAVLSRLEARTPDEWGPAIERLCAELRRPVPTVSAAPPCPYPGMSPFREDQQDQFFGREQEREELLQRLRLERFVAVIGPSGSGKSSLVQAGLLPALRRSRLFGPGEWVTRVIRPGEAPQDELLKALDGRAGQPIGAATGLLARHGADARLLLVVDQLEELFTTAASETETFQEALLSLAEAPGGHVVVTMRADFYPELMAAPLWRAVQGHRLEVVPLQGAALRRAIVLPAEGSEVFVEPALVERLLAEAAGEPGALPLIQETLVLLWERLERRLLPLRAYDALVLPSSVYGHPPQTGFQVAIARRADAAMADLPEEWRAIARRILLRLVQFGEGRDDVRRQQPVSSLSSTTDEGGAFEQTLRHLVAWRLVTATGEPDDDDSRVDLCHEALISGWPTFQAWVAERRGAEQIRRRLEEQAGDWARRGSGDRGLLDDVEVLEAERWLASPDAKELGIDDTVVALTEQSRAALEQDRRREEEARQRELAQAQALARAQTNRARLLRRALAAVTLATVLAVGAAGVATVERRNADDKAMLALSRQLATQSELLAGTRLDLALLLAARANQTRTIPAARSSLLAALEADPHVESVLHGHTDQVNSVAFSPDGTLVAAAGDDHTVRLWNARTGRPHGAPLTGHTDKVRTIAFSSDGTMLASGSVDQTIILWDPRTGQRLGKPLRGHTDVVRSLAFSPDGTMLASGSVDQTIILWDPRTGLQVGKPLRGHTDWVNSVAFASNRLLASAGGRADDTGQFGTGPKDTRILLWDVRTGKRAGRPLDGHTDAVRSLAVSPGGRILASAGQDLRILLWDLRTGERLGRPLVGYRNRIFSLAFSPDGAVLASGDRDHRIVLWDVRSRRRTGPPLVGHAESVRSVAFARDGTLASASNDRKVILWNLARNQRLGQALPAGVGGVRSIAFSPDGRVLAAGGDRRPEIALWDARTRRRLGGPLVGHSDRIGGLAFSPDSRTLASASWDQTARLWDVATGRPRRPPLSGHAAAVTSVAFSPDGRLLATGSADQTVRVWDVATGQPVGQPLRGHRNWVNSVAFGPDSQTLASAGQDGNVLLWRLSDPAHHGQPVNETATALSGLAFSPKRRLLATGSIENVVAIWDLDAARPIRRPLALVGHPGVVRSVAFSQDGNLLVSGGAGGAVMLWDANVLEPIGRPLTGHAGDVWGVAVSPDGTVVASGGEDDSVVLWDTRLGSWMAAACRTANRNLSPAEWQRYIGPGIRQEPVCPDLPPGDDAWN